MTELSCTKKWNYILWVQHYCFAKTRNNIIIYLMVFRHNHHETAMSKCVTSAKFLIKVNDKQVYLLNNKLVLAFENYLHPTHPNSRVSINTSTTLPTKRALLKTSSTTW